MIDSWYPGDAFVDWIGTLGVLALAVVAAYGVQSSGSAGDLDLSTGEVAGAATRLHSI